MIKQLIKATKIMLLLIAISFFALIPFNAEAKDCSGFKVASHKWIMCKVGKGVEPDKTGKGVEPDKKREGGSFWKKIKNFGGKNIGEEG